MSDPEDLSSDGEAEAGTSSEVPGDRTEEAQSVEATQPDEGSRPGGETHLAAELPPVEVVEPVETHSAAEPDPVEAVEVVAAVPVADKADELDGLDDADELDDLEDLSPWAGLAVSIGTGLIAVVAVQVLLAVVEGLTLHSGERAGVADDLLHRLGYPFDGLGTIALFLLITGVIVVSLPSIVGEELAPGHDRMVSVALVVSAVLAVVIALGSILAVRANLHITVAQYSANQRSIPSFVRVRLASFLLGSLGAAALALFGSLAARGHRAAERWEG